VLVVDDSPLFVEVMTALLAADPDFRLVGVARDGLQAVEAAARLRPHLITMDIQMPVMDGLQAIERIMSSAPTPILVLTGDPRVGGEVSFEALRRGGLDVMAKDQIWSLSADQQGGFREHLKLLAGVSVVRRARRKSGPLSPTPRGAPAAGSRLQPPRPAAPSCGRAVALVASTGGPAALAQILAALPAEFPTGIVVLQHISDGFTAVLADWLNQVSALRVRLATEGAPLAPGSVLLAPDGCHTLLGPGGSVTLDDSPPLRGHRPSGTRLLQSLAAHYGSAGVAAILTGMGDDGVEGLRAVRDAGGITVAQDEASSVVFGMPQAALQSGAARHCLPLAQIAEALCRFVGARSRSA
jgi:two-component system chemotaxis response regulator CheB